ncbi:hypothetical protein KJI95_05435 [Shewanella sp. JM162201]|uniref:Uncharacterized protein n=2 Tax=Shewanella jiangmenensis TaxID=2837387 RepID=A0ABS5V0H7_9GAMM|nr:hypothetical protein [Shewanella jiangmenensis]MBT1443967.1 hypothetical protein [Shewanella jiangmenensis]
MLMLGIALLSLSLMLGDIVALAKTLAAEMIQSGQLANGLAGDPAALLQLVRERSAELERAEWSFYLLLGVWLVAVGDSLRLILSHPRRG